MFYVFYRILVHTLNRRAPWEIYMKSRSMFNGSNTCVISSIFYLLLLIEMKTDSEWVLVSSAPGVDEETNRVSYLLRHLNIRSHLYHQNKHTHWQLFPDRYVSSINRIFLWALCKRTYTAATPIPSRVLQGPTQREWDKVVHCMELIKRGTTNPLG